MNREKVFLTGNTVVDAVNQNLELAKRGSNILKELELTSAGFVLATSHREENVDDPVRFKGIVEGLRKVSIKTGAEVIYPVHPRAKKRLAEHGLDTSGLRLVEPLGYLEFLQLESRALLVLTDSGGVQEEACILGVPCVTMRDTTERPETVSVGANVLAGTDPEKILKAAVKMLDSSWKWSNPFGDGKAAQRIVDIALE
jgi:UDP-N-acetylglucosamine 2-epimerase (non-hydrolysing)